MDTVGLIYITAVGGDQHQGLPRRPGGEGERDRRGRGRLAGRSRAGPIRRRITACPCLQVKLPGEKKCAERAAVASTKMNSHLGHTQDLKSTWSTVSSPNDHERHLGSRYNSRWRPTNIKIPTPEHIKKLLGRSEHTGFSSDCGVPMGEGSLSTSPLSGCTNLALRTVALQTHRS